jgi:hypothetical protein
MPKIFLEIFVNPKLSPPPFINKFNETHLKFKSLCLNGRKWSPIEDL